MSASSVERYHLDNAKRNLFSRYDSENRGLLNKVLFSKALRDLLMGINYNYTKEEYNSILNEAYQLFDANKDGYIDYEEFNSMIDFFIIEQGFELEDFMIA